MITVQDILEIPNLNLRLLAGHKAVTNPVRWVHITEMADPTRWLRGGELLLTTGLGVQNAEDDEQRAMLRRLIEANVSGLGFGVGFGFKKVPQHMIELADEHDFPLFEVPYNIPFIAITEAVASKIVNEQYSLLQRSLAVHEKLTRIVLEEKGLQFIISTLAALVGCSAVLFDFHGLVLCEASHRRRIPTELVADLWRQISDKRARRQHFGVEGHGQAAVQVYPVVASHRIGAFLAVMKDTGDFSDYDRIILHHIVTVTALELVKKKAVAETEKRLAGDFFDELIASDLYEEEIARRLAFFGLDPETEHLVALVDIDAFKAFVDGQGDKQETVVQDIKERLHWAVDEFLAQRDLPFISASRSDSVVVLLQPGEESHQAVLDMAAELQQAIGEMIPEVTVSVGIGRPHRSLVDLRQSYYEAHYAIKIRKLKGGVSVIASFDDLGSYGLLLGLQDTLSLEVFYDSVLGKLEAYDRQNSSDLVKSLACFLDANGHWGEAAERLYVHRHTLRYRMKRVEEITGRDLGSSQDRMEFWLALKAKELIDQAGKKPKTPRG